MANEQNLVPLNQRTKSEQRKITSKGGKASGKARRKRKALGESMKALLELIPNNPEDFNAASLAGLDLDDIDNSQLIVLALFNKAKSGDVAAIKELRSWIGEDKDKLKEAEQKQRIELLKAQTEKIKADQENEKGKDGVTIIDDL